MANNVVHFSPAIKRRIEAGGVTFEDIAEAWNDTKASEAGDENELFELLLSRAERHADARNKKAAPLPKE